MNVQLTTTMPRDISQSQLWIEDGSISSIESFSEDEEESSDDESCCEEKYEIACDLRRSYPSSNKLIPSHLRHKKRQLSPPCLPRRSTFQNGLQEEEPAPVSRWAVSRSCERAPSSIRLSRSRRSPSRPSMDSDALLRSPMAKFRSNTSDSALSASRSFQSQRLRVSQANAKWSVNRKFNARKTKPDLTNIFANNVNDSLRSNSLRLNDESKESQNLLPQKTSSHGDLDSAVGSRETRWSTSTHTRDAGLSVVRPRRRPSGASLHDSRRSLLSFGEVGSLSSSTGKGEQDEIKLKPESSGPVQSKSNLEAFSSSATGSFVEALITPGNPRNHNSCSSGAFSMEDALQQVMALEPDEDGLELDGVDLQFPQVAEPRSDRTACSADSLVSLMNPFNSSRQATLHKKDLVK